MENPTCTNILDLVGSLQTHVELRKHFPVSSESIADVINILTELIATLREDLNSRNVPLLRLPVEILQRILEEVPDRLFARYDFPFQPFWHWSALDLSMLMPVSQTCRQLRRIALSHMSLWKTVRTMTTNQYVPPPILLQKGCDIPLIVAIDGASREDWGILHEVQVQRTQELHVFQLYLQHHPSDSVATLNRFFRFGLPLLESVFLDEISRGPGDKDECPVPLETAPKLLHMMLRRVSFIPSNAFPRLTHLSLSDIRTRDCHTDIANLLSRCPNLESLAICFPPHLHMPPNAQENLPPSLSLNRPRRITLQLPKFHNPITDFYVSLLPLAMDSPTRQPVALQILQLAVADSVSALAPMLYRVTNAEATHPSLSLRPHPRGKPWEYLSVSATGPKGTFHACTQAFRGEDGIKPHHVLDVFPKPFLDAVLCRCCAHLRAAVREVWVTSVDPRTARQLSREVTEHFKAVIAALPALETAVVVVASPVMAGDELDLEVNLGVLPSAHDPGFASSNLKTLRIVHRDGARKTGDSEESGEKIRLTKLLDQIGTGAYGYLDNVLLQVTPPLEVDKEDLALLEACFRRVAFQRIDSVPVMPLPEYCKEPYAGGGSGQWVGSLW